MLLPVTNRYAFSLSPVFRKGHGTGLAADVDHRVRVVGTARRHHHDCCGALPAQKVLK